MPGRACAHSWGKPMDEPRSRPGPEGPGRLDEWLAAQVRPLPPPPGTLELIRRRARRRKLARAAATASMAVVIVAGLATVPRLVISQLGGSGPARGAAAGSTLAPTTATPSSPAPPHSPAPTPAAAPGPNPVPPSFRPVSVTFVGTSTGWVIGQAKKPGECGPPFAYICTSLARTDDAGQTWHGVPAPVTGQANGAHGVSQLRFLDLADGWAFGPELWATHDGGQRWARIATHGLRVTALETRGATAYAVWAQCTGTGAGYARHCTTAGLYASPAGSDAWRPVPGAQNLPAGGPGRPQLLLTGTGSYLLMPDGALLAGPADGPGRWQRGTGTHPAAVPCTPGPAGQLLAVTGTSGMVAMCPGQGGSTQWTLLSSGDGGRTWRIAGNVSPAGRPASLAGTLAGALVLATSQGIGLSRDGGATWQAAQVRSPPPGGFSYVGMTSPRQGVAVPAGPGQRAIWFTYDGGLTWQPSPVR